MTTIVNRSVLQGVIAQMLAGVLAVLAMLTGQLIAQAPSETTEVFPENPFAPPEPEPGEVLTDLRFEEPLGEFRTGGTGRYLVFHNREQRLIRLFDVVQQQMIGELPLPSEDVIFACGRDKLMIVLTGQRLVMRYSLPELKREALRPLGEFTELNPLRCYMGHASSGPLLLFSKHEGVLWDIDKMAPIDTKVFTGHNKHGFHITVSADGQTFQGWVDTGSPGGTLHNMRLVNGLTEFSKGPGDIHGPRQFQPNFDGTQTYGNDGAIWDHALRRVPADSISSTPLAPSEDRQFFFRIHGWDKDCTIDICTAADRQIVYTFKGLDELGPRPRYPAPHAIDEPRIRYVPTANAIVTLPPGNKRIVVRSLNLLKELGRQERVVVYSMPPTFATRGEKYSYQLEAVSQAGDFTYRLESGPRGMEMNDEGKLVWHVPPHHAAEREYVIVSVQDSDQREGLHSFAIDLQGELPLAENTEPEGGVPDDPAPESGASNLASGAIAPQPVVLPKENVLALDAASGVPTPGLDRKSMFLLQENSLWILDAGGSKVKQRIALPKTYQCIAERPGYFVACANESKSIDVIDKETHKVMRSLKLGRAEFRSIALHPRLPLSYVSYRSGFEVPSYHFVMFDETTGEGRENDNFIGTWLKIDPRGKFLVAGYRDLYQKGNRLIMNPRQWHITPEYGDISWLIRYDLASDGMPAEQPEVKENAGGNGQGIRMSQDGRRVTYLSHVGYPMYSHNLAGWDPTDLAKTPVMYELKDRGTTYDLAFHPVLPLVASPGSGSAYFMHRDSGEPEKDRLPAPPGFLAKTKVDRVYFSADGESLLFDFKLAEKRYLLRSPLRLSDAELVKIAAGAPDFDFAHKAAAKVPLKEFDALQGGFGTPMTTKEIAKESASSVVLVQNGRSSGTGYVVGSNGLIVTCDHCVDDSPDTVVHFVSVEGDRREEKSRQATVLAIDHDSDLALLRIDANLPPVRLAVGQPVASGERVTAIGNPGVGKLVLRNTVTEGVVSSPRRSVRGKPFIQTSAAVNHGSSGGPMFNEQGLVIGHVVLKADIEGAAFGVPVDAIAEFLLNHASFNGPDAHLTRTWYHSDRTRKVSAKFLRIDGDHVVFVGRDEMELRMPIALLHEADRTFLQYLAKAADDAEHESDAPEGKP